MARDANIPGKLAGVLLCGGLSSRMGRDKTLLEVEGEALWLRQRRHLRTVLGEEPLLSVRSGVRLAGESGDHSAPRYVFDDGSSGPLGGILAALDAVEREHFDSRATHLAVLAVDMPLMDASWWESLARACGPAGGAVGRIAGGGDWEPLAAIYPLSMRPLFHSAESAGVFSLQKIVAKGVAAGLLRELPITAEQQKFFRNWNTPTDLEQPF